MNDAELIEVFRRIASGKVKHGDFLTAFARALGRAAGDFPMSEKLNIWQDPSVKAALKDGRLADDIAVLQCPKCHQWGYYNQGSHFYCRACKEGWYVCSENEEPPSDRQYLVLDGFTSLADTVPCGDEP